MASLWRIEAQMSEDWGWEAPISAGDKIRDMHIRGVLTAEEIEYLLDPVTGEYNGNEIIIGDWRVIHFNVGGNIANNPGEDDDEIIPGGIPGTPGNPILPPTEEISVQNKFSRAIGVVEIVWLDLSNNVIENPLSPANHLVGMTPVAHNGSVWQATTAGDANWYNYDAQRWANARDNNQNMFVWIPRYAYRIAYFGPTEGFTAEQNANQRRVDLSSTRRVNRI